MYASVTLNCEVFFSCNRLEFVDLFIDSRNINVSIDLTLFLRRHFDGVISTREGLYYKNITKVSRREKLSVFGVFLLHIFPIIIYIEK